jgi:uncharacterized membrane protein YsdA (DUF1294 family)/cold shock CspA family protein
MRHKGRIAQWQDDRGFGFIESMSGGERVFVHVKSFTNRHRRPVTDDLVTFELTHDPRGRPQGVNVTFTGDRTLRATSPMPGATSLLVAATFLISVFVAVIAGRLPVFVFWLYSVGSGITFLAYGWDKSSARPNRWRTTESTLHLLSLVGGWPGALIAQKYLRHKSSKQSFQNVFWGMVVLNCGGLVFLLMNPEILWR